MEEKDCSHQDDCCMTAPTLDNVFFVGELKDPNKPIPMLPAKEIEAAAERIKQITKHTNLER